MTAPARTPEQRRLDSLDRLEHDVDAWVATAGDNGNPYLIPLSFLWDGSSLIISTPASSTTSRNLLASRKVRVGIGPTRDLVLIEGIAEAVTQVDAELGDAFAAKAGFDPRELRAPYQYFRIRPRRLQAWREVNELEGRNLMREGEWLVPD
jgi:Pyridoxamine 5'-phosphate oxidase